MNYLLLNGGKEFGHSHGELNNTLHKKSKRKFLTATWTQCKRNCIDAGYELRQKSKNSCGWMP